jgi:penicillin-binding protein 1C
MLDLHGASADPAALAFPTPQDYRLRQICTESGEPDSRDCGDRLPEWRRADAPPVAAATSQLSDRIDLTGETATTIAIVSPRNNMRVIRNPELPADLASLPLKVSTDATVSQVTWYVDGKPFQVSAAGEITRWPLQPGQHTFQAKVPYRDTASPVVTIEVQ